MLNVREWGAAGDGAADDTGPIQAALDKAAGAGERVFVPPGRYACRTLFVRSDTTLELAAGATLVGPARLEDFTPVNYQDPLHAWDNGTKRHFIVIADAQRVRLCGAGAIEGRGWLWSRDGETPDSWRVAPNPRPAVMVAAIRCQDLTLEGLTLTDPPNWHLDMYCCDRVRMHGVKIASDPRLPNNDGVDISGSQDVTISDCILDVGDDGIVINGRGREVRRVAISNCLIRSQCGAVKIGWEYTLNRISQIAVSNCVLTGCSRGVCAYSCAGATIEDVTVSNLVVDNQAPIMFSRPIHLDLRRDAKTGRIGAMRRIQIANVVARTPGRILMTSQEGGWLEDVTLRDVHLAYPYLEDPEPDAEGNTSSQFSNDNRAARRARAAVVAENARNLAVDGLRLTWPNEPVPAEWRIPVKRENGGRRLFRPDYDRPRPCSFAALWARNVHGWWRAPLAAASEPDAAPFDQDEFTRRNLTRAD
jgi:polygalacturonase